MSNKKLSLAVIAGNVEQYIARFLTCFGPMADEIIVVRAIGSLEPDRTLDIADSMGARTAEFINMEHPDWPHVDNYAAARNMAFLLARNEFVMWADTDDIIDGKSVAAIKTAIANLPKDADAIEFLYDIPEDGLKVYRERIIRKGIARWVGRVHECLSFDPPPKILRLSDAIIRHAPSGSRARNDERNLRILESIKPEERTLSERFHLFQSLRAVGRVDEAVTEATSLLANPPAGMGDPEKYELFIACGQLTNDPGTRAQMMLQAIAVDPSRREAYGELALYHIACGNSKKAVALTSVMRSIRQPSEDIWNRRGKYYTWLGEQLHGMALRRAGKFVEADVLETNHFVRSGAKISLLHATRGRVKKAVECRRMWLNLAANPDAIEHIFGLDTDDEDAPYLAVHNHAVVEGGKGSVAAWNAVARKSKGEILVQLSDDWVPPPRWDQMILDAMADATGPAVLAISDGHRNDKLLCMAILNRARYEQQGYMFHPGFYSVYSDNWFTDSAYRDGVVIDRRDIVFEHRHPIFTGEPLDASYQRSNSEPAYRIGAELYDILTKHANADTSAARDPRA